MSLTLGRILHKRMFARRRSFDCDRREKFVTVQKRVVSKRQGSGILISHPLGTDPEPKRTDKKIPTRYIDNVVDSHQLIFDAT